MKLLLILLLAASLRLWNLPNRMVFLADQGRDMLRVYQLYTARRLTLLGPPSSQGNFFFGPLYYYLIAPGLILARWHPIGASLTVILVDLIGIYFLFRLTQSFSLTLIYATNPLLIDWSQSTLNPFFIPGFGLICLYCRKHHRFFLAGFLAGAMVQLHYSAALFVLLIFSLDPRFLLGLALGLSPLFAFELRHEFFNTKAILDFLTTPGQHYFNLHYLTFLVPFIFVYLPRHLPALIISLMLLFQLSRLDLNPSQGYTMPVNWNLPSAKLAASLVAQDVRAAKPASFNIASTLDGDSRALPLRYLLISQFRTIPKGVEEYPQAQVLYLVSRWDQNTILRHGLWEISSFASKTVAQTWPIVADINLYRLER